MIERKIYKTKINYEYSLIDLLSIDNNEYYDDMSLCPLPLEVHQNYFRWQVSAEISEVLSSAVFTRLWKYHILLRYAHSYCAVNEKDIDFVNIAIEPIIINDIFGKFWRRFESIAVETFERYSSLIDVYKTAKGKLLNKVESKTSSKASFNDTPQIELSDPYDTKFSNHTNVSEYDNSSDATTIANRIKEIDNAIKNVYKEWANEFDSLFVPSEEDING